MTTTPPATVLQEEAARAAVLIVEDDAAARVSLEAVLSTHFEVETAKDADDAEAVLGKREFDVVITDYEMPGRSGLELLARIEDLYPNILGILLTGHVDLPEVRAAKRDKTVFYVLVKPYEPGSLVHWAKAAAGAAKLRRTMNTLRRSVTPQRAGGEG